MICRGDFLKRIEAIAKTNPKAIILREKELTENEYMILAKKVMTICQNNNVLCILHSYVGTAIRLGASAIHLPLHLLRNMKEDDKRYFTHISASCHSLSEAREAEKLGCTSLIVGHIFSTECKRGIPPRGLECLSEICKTVSIPIYAIGGINHRNFPSVIHAGAKGGCVMSGFIECDNIHEYMEGFKDE